MPHITMDDVIPICRACLKTSLKYIDFETPLETQSETTEASGNDRAAQKSFITYWDCFRACTKLELSAHEERMPQSLCDECGVELGIAYEFLQKALHADKLLKQAAIKTGSKTINDFNTPDISKHGTDRVTDVKGELVSEERPVLLGNRKVLNNEIIEVSSIEGDDLDTDTNDDNVEQQAQSAVMHFCTICEQCFDTQSKLNLHWAQQHDDILDSNEHEHRSQPTIATNSEQLMDTVSCQQAQLPSGEDYYFLEFLEVAADDTSKELFYKIEQFEDGDGALEKVDSIPKETTANMDTDTDIDARFSCRGCEQSFYTQRMLLQHWRTQHSSSAQAAKCKVCHKHVSKPESMRRHLQRAHSAIVQCKKCEHRCKESKLAEHEQRAHAERLDFVCNICSKKFSTQNMLKSHLKYHQRKEANMKSDACEICGKQFSTKHYLRQHMDLHRNERQLHQCEHCDKIYVTKTALENHLRLHKGETIKCDECGKQFVRQYELNVHMRFHTRDYPFQCEICDKKFAIKGHLRTHMWRHQGLKLQCEECGKLFTSTKALQEHSFVHTEMPYPCSYCGRAYPSKQKFKVHLKTTHLLELTEDELQKVQKHQIPKPLQRKKLTLVQADTVMKEVEVKNDDEEEATSENIEEILVDLC